MIPKAVLRNPWVQAGALVGGLALVILLMWFLRPVLVPLFFAFLVAYILDPVAQSFEAKGISRSKTITAMALLAILLVLAVPFAIVPSIFSQAETLRANRQARIAHADSQAASDAGSDGVVGSVRNWGNGLLDRIPFWHLLEVIPETDTLEANMSETGQDTSPPQEDSQPSAGVVPETPSSVENQAAEMPAHEIDYSKMPPAEVRAELADRIGTYVKLNARNILQAYAPTMAVAGQRAGVTVAHLVSSLGQWTLGAVVFLANLALFSFVAGYLLKDFDLLVANARNLLPIRYRPKIEEIVTKIHEQITSFLRGQLTVCMCLAVMYMFGLTLSGVPFAIPIGLFGGLAAFIPYLGITLTMIPAILLTLVAHGLDGHLIGVLVTFGLAQFLEGTFLTPKIVGDKVGLNPVWVILAILVFGNAFGFLGILLAVPMAASLKVLVLEGVAYYKASRVFRESGGSGDAS